MPRLDNVKWEAFCQNYSKSGNATDAYKEAGYKWKDDASANSAASRLLRNVKVITRLKELGQAKEKASIAERMRKRHKGEAEHKEDFETCLRLAEKAEEEREERRRWEQ